VLKERRKKKASDLQNVDVETGKYSSNAVLESLIKIGITRLGKLTAIFNQCERQSYPLPPCIFQYLFRWSLSQVAEYWNRIH
jgi:hypothetical protein